MIVENLNGSNGGTTLVTAVIDSEGYLHWGAVGIVFSRSLEMVNF